MEAIHYDLKVPLQSKSEGSVKQLTFARRPQAKDFKGLPADLDQDANMKFLSRLTNTELYLIEQLDAYDYIELGKIVQLFLVTGPMVGKGPSGK